MRHRSSRVSPRPSHHSVLSTLIPLTLVIFAVSTQAPARVSGETPEAAQRQITSLRREAQTLRAQQRALRAERDQLAQALRQRETLLLMRAYQPRVVRAMRDLTSSLTSPKARSPLPKKRARVRYMERSGERARKRDLRDLLARTPTVIALWATWCKPCVSPEEQAHLQRLKQRLQTYGVPLVSIGVDQWSKVKRDQARWFYPLWHLKDAHLNLTPEVIFREVGMGLPLFLLRLPDGSVPYYLAQTLSDESVEEWVTLAVRAKLSYSPE